MMLDFLKNNDNDKDMDSVFLDTMQNLDLCSAFLQFKMFKGEMKWSDEQIQTFLPLILQYTNFDWLELIAKNEYKNEDYRVIKEFLEHTQHLMKNGENVLYNKGVENGVW